MSTDEQSFPSHQPVLYQETIEALRPHSGARYLDGTLGAGGHAAGILEASAPEGRLLGLDLDLHALALAKQSLALLVDRATLIHGSYAEMQQHCREHAFTGLAGILLDLGASSMQFDEADRGFSFRNDGPLDMRFNSQASLTAAVLINEWDEEELADLIFRYGEEAQSRRIAKAIVQSRPLATTKQLADLIKQTIKGKRGKIHPATKTFQALRIAVNDELNSLEIALPQTLDLLIPGGRLAVISFHSLEDRIVKRFVRRESKDCICPPEQAICTCDHAASLKEIVRKPVRPTQKEQNSNPRARSARLRVAERI